MQEINNEENGSTKSVKGRSKEDVYKLINENQMLFNIEIFKARLELESFGAFDPVALVGNFDSGNGVTIKLDMDRQVGQDKSISLIKSEVQSLNADFVFIIAAALTLHEENHHMIDEIMERYGSIQNSPYAVRAVSITIETRHGVWLAVQPLEKIDGSKEHLTFANPAFEFNAQSGGRFANLISEKSNEVRMSENPIHLDYVGN